MDVQEVKLAFFTVWHWTWPDDLDTPTSPRYGQDVPLHQKWSFFVYCFKKFSPNRHKDTHTHRDTRTDRQKHRQYENITSSAYAGGNNFFVHPEFYLNFIFQHSIKSVCPHPLIQLLFSADRVTRCILHIRVIDFTSKNFGWGWWIS